MPGTCIKHKPVLEKHSVLLRQKDNLEQLLYKRKSCNILLGKHHQTLVSRTKYSPQYPGNCRLKQTRFQHDPWYNYTNTSDFNAVMPGMNLVHFIQCFPVTMAGETKEFWWLSFMPNLQLNHHGLHSTRYDKQGWGSGQEEYMDERLQETFTCGWVRSCHWVRNEPRPHAGIRQHRSIAIIMQKAKTIVELMFLSFEVWKCPGHLLLWGHYKLPTEIPPPRI